MAEYTLSNAAGVIDSAITRVASADTTPTNNSQAMVTSGGVKAALDNLATGSTLTVDSFASTALETSGDTLTATDTAVPTSAAVKNYVDNSVSTTTIGCGSFIIDGNLNDDSYSASSSTYVPLKLDNVFSTGQVGSVSSTTITLPAGTYFVQPSFVLSTNTTGTWDLSVRHNNSDVLKSRVSSNGYEAYDLVGGVFVSSTGLQTIRIYAYEASGGNLRLFGTSNMVISRLF
tara:strand:- start:928 stop:1620 length:693 start_codon:yes stop_codon:yes gene_type:complete